MKNVMFVEGSYEDKLYVDGEYLGRVDTLTVSELLCLLAKNNAINLEIKTED
jgi:hypothetical protein